jgi:hypothetical protein
MKPWRLPHQLVRHRLRRNSASKPGLTDAGHIAPYMDVLAVANRVQQTRAFQMNRRGSPQMWVEA